MSPLPWWEPELLAAVLQQRYGHQGLVWLDGDGSEHGRYAVLAAGPTKQVRCDGLPHDPGASDPFKALQQAFAHGAGHWLGWLSYEAAAWIEPGEHWHRPSMAQLWAGHYEVVIELDLQEQHLQLRGTGQQHAELERLLQQPQPKLESSDAALPLKGWQWLTSTADYGHQVEQVRDWISAGDLFQANLTACAEQQLNANIKPLALYRRLRRHCPAPFGGLMLASCEEAVLSTSPERFLQVSATGLVETRPIKGTRPRHDDPTQDADAAAELVCSAKDRAENVMIVDLMRNDLGRVCRNGSIEVPQLVGLESYRQVHHLTSVVTGQLHDPSDLAGLLRACWPGGSITGAPKIRTCQQLNALEPVARGPYCGSFFHRRPDGSFDSNILIRSLLLKGSTVRIHGGCGIVADSDPAQETEELGWKVQPLLQALS